MGEEDVRTAIEASLPLSPFTLCRASQPPEPGHGALLPIMPRLSSDRNMLGQALPGKSLLSLALVAAFQALW